MEQVAYFESNDDVFKYLSQASQLYVSARKKHIELMAQLRGRKVAFKDIRPYLLNRAAEIGLLERGMRESECKGRAWYVSLTNFMSFVKKYSDYGIVKCDIKNASKGKDKVVTTKTKVIKKDKDGNILSVSEKEVQGTVGERIEAMKAQKAQEDAARLLEPIEKGLSEAETWAIIARNLHLLGKFCEEKHATKQFNDLMESLGFYEEMIEIDDVVVAEQLEEMIQPVM